jgi:hypothetical protein
MTSTLTTAMASAATFARLARRLGGEDLRPELPELGAP